MPGGEILRPGDEQCQEARFYVRRQQITPTTMGNGQGKRKRGEREGRKRDRRGEEEKDREGGVKEKREGKGRGGPVQTG